MLPTIMPQWWNFAARPSSGFLAAGKLSADGQGLSMKGTQVPLRTQQPLPGGKNAVLFGRIVGSGADQAVEVTGAHLLN
jgi:hypothetical protein